LTKEHREKISLDKLSKIMPDGVRSEILELINEYQNKLSPEARFVYELDKIQPLMMEVLE
jgi:5'-deoxynucleotidase YfbR-like HD superfamily hydrolase